MACGCYHNWLAYCNSTILGVQIALHPTIFFTKSNSDKYNYNLDYNNNHLPWK